MYRLQKAKDATTTFFSKEYGDIGTGTLPSPLPSNHKFSRNDVIVLTLQPRGTGDFLSSTSLPTNPDAVLLEARVLNVGPTYLDVAIAAGQFIRVFGPASNNGGIEGRGDPAMRVRVDRFFSDVPFQRMMAALGQLTSVQKNGGGGGKADDKRVGGFQMDNLLKEVILSTFKGTDDAYNMLDESEDVNLGELVSV